MAYETGTATSRDDLLDKLRAFLVANGWNQEGWAVDGTGYRLHVSKGGIYANFRTAARTEKYVNNSASSTADFNADQLSFNISTGYNGASAWWNQPGKPPVPADRTFLYMTTGIAWGNGSADAWNTVYSYHFFENDDTVSVVVEGQPGSFKHLHFGKLDEYNIGVDEVWFYTGFRRGIYASTSYAFTSDVRDRTPSYVYLSDSSTWLYNGTGIRLNPPIPNTPAGTSESYRGWLSSLLLTDPLDLGTHVLLPLIFSVKASGQTYYYPAGQVKNVRAAIASHDEAAEIVLGDDTWMLFSNTYRSIAIKKVVGGE